MLLLSILAHHSEPGDPILFDWIRHQIDAILGLGPMAIVVVLGFVVAAIPLAIVGLYLAQRARFGPPT